MASLEGSAGGGAPPATAAALDDRSAAVVAAAAAATTAETHRNEAASVAAPPPSSPRGSTPPPAQLQPQHDDGAPPPEAPESLLGRRCVRVFGGKPYDGVITRVRVTQAHGTLYRVHYPEDDDGEELTWHELRDALLPPAQPAASDDAIPPSAAAAALPPPSATPSPAEHTATPAALPQQRYKGVCVRAHGQFQAFLHTTSGLTDLGWYDNPEEAARAYDAAVRAQGRRVVNFSDTRAGEVQALPKMSDAQALKRAAQQPRAAAAAPRSAAAAPKAYRARARSSAGAAAPEAMQQATAAATRADLPLFGRRVSVPFEARGVTKLFRGTVLPCRRRGGKYSVSFDDGDVRDDFTASELQKCTIRSDDDDDDSGNNTVGAAAASAAAAGGGGIARAPIACRYRGVRPSSRKSSRFSAELCMGRACRISVGVFDTEDEAARAIDAEARRRGLPQLLNFPANAAERAAVAKWNARPHIAWAAARRAKKKAALSSAAAAGVQAAPAPAPRENRHAKGAPPGGAGSGGGAAKKSAASAQHAAPPAKRCRVMEPLPPSVADGAGKAATRRMPAAAAPTAAPATRAAHAAAAAAAHENGGGDDTGGDVSQLLSFLRGITPPLSNLRAVLDAARCSGITLAHLAQLSSSSSSSAQKMALNIATASLRIEASGDKMAFALALAPLAQRAGAAGGSDGGMEE
jgi:hypothetical protein